MFQDFDVSSRPEQGIARLDALRVQMKTAGVDGFLVPRADRFQGEYVAPRDARLEWLTGFSGSAGFACILADEAGVFIDGRYRVQVKDQVALDVFTPVHWPETSLDQWVRERAEKIDVLAFDPWLHSATQIETLKTKFEGTGIKLRAVANLVDQIWTDQPAPPTAPFTIQPLEFAGESSIDKRARIGDLINQSGAKSVVITQPDSVAWLLNIRGQDIERNPVPHAMALLRDDGQVTLLCDPQQANGLDLGGDVHVAREQDLADHLANLPQPVLFDPQSAPYQLTELLTGAETRRGADPCLLPKACKNPVEIQGARTAHLRDGAAMVRFLAWLDETAPKGGLSEIDVVTQLESFRRDTNALRDISFETICGVADHGAIVHYRVSTDTNADITANELLLIDSGGQYQDGTTDITRTVIIGAPNPDHIVCYTRVLQGMIAVSRARFPIGVAGGHLDALARFPLWTAGLDYDHGTGHGVGSYLSVHEGPQRISRTSDLPLDVGMILSNEPGYYREGAFGIRIENLIVVIPAPELAGADDRQMRSFETLTYVPFDRRLIDVSLLSAAERDWIDAYHATTLARIGPRVDGSAKRWLNAACAPL
ncbi:aminopeptidase P family protein [Aestuariibius sp. HNIBRBA575]|uniref:aminopeptidase P family protein n=1 Tax=Aestuariibius sp. HNIBRBA575 TaxID=3233343 RepID=UPI0034A20444